MKNLIELLILVILISSCMVQSKLTRDQRYQAENDSLRLANADVEVVLMGNSITDSWPGMRPEFFEKTQYVGRGIGGQTTPQMLLRFEQDVIELSPKIVVILAGTNDIAGNTGPMTLEETLANVAKMTQEALDNQINVVIASVLPAYDYPWSPGKNPHLKIPALNHMLRSYAKEKDLIYLDYFAAMEDGKNGLRDSLTYDGVHPNEAGYQVMEPLLVEAVEKAIKK